MITKRKFIKIAALTTAFLIIKPLKAAFNAFSGNVPEGGGGEPEWVPEGAVIHIDLVGGSPQGRAWVFGVGEVAVDTLLGEDAATLSGWGNASAYNPGGLGADGYQLADALAFLGAAKTALLSIAGATLRVRIKQTQNNTLDIVSVTADGNYYFELQLRSTDLLGAIVPKSSSNVYTLEAYNAAPGGINVLAVTQTRARADLAANGVDAVTQTLVVDSDIPEGGFDAIFIEQFTGPSIQTITIYDALPSTTGLSALSVA